MCSCANECVHVGPISTFDLNNSNSGVAQISNRARLVISRSIRSQTPRDRWHWPHVPSRTLLFKVFFVLSWIDWTRWTESWQLWSFQLVGNMFLKPKLLASSKSLGCFRLACWWPRWRRSPRSSGSRSSPSSSSTSATRCVCPCRWPLTLWPLRNLFSRKTSSSGTVLPTRGC